MKNRDWKSEDLQMMGLRIKALRTAKGMTQQELADRVNLSRERIQGYEAGKNEPGVLKIRDIMAVLDASIDDLLYPVSIESTSVYLEEYEHFLDEVSLDYDDRFKITVLQVHLVEHISGDSFIVDYYPPHDEMMDLCTPEYLDDEDIIEEKKQLLDEYLYIRPQLKLMEYKDFIIKINTQLSSPPK